jgi:hypothetical protein
MKMELSSIILLVTTIDVGGQVRHEHIGTVIESDFGGLTGPSDFNIAFLV